MYIYIYIYYIYYIYIYIYTYIIYDIIIYVCVYVCDDARVSAFGSIYACTYVRTYLNRYNIQCMLCIHVQHVFLHYTYNTCLIRTYAEHYFDQCTVIGTTNAILFSARHLSDFISNLAIGKDSAQSRWYKSSVFGANGVRTGLLERGCTLAPYHKSFPTYSWWKVELEYVYDVKLVMFLNRGDCCGELYITAYSVLIHIYTLGIISVRVLMLLVRHLGNTLRFG